MENHKLENCVKNSCYQSYLEIFVATFDIEESRVRGFNPALALSIFTKSTTSFW